MALLPPREVFVFDSSSIIEVRQRVEKRKQRNVFDELRRRADTGTLVFPPEVLKELERHATVAQGKPDPPLEWARACPNHAIRKVPWEIVKAVIERVGLVFDPDKTGTEEADPYVLALATQIRDEGDKVVVVTEDWRDKPNKRSIATACGILRIPSLRLQAFLETEGIWMPG